MAILNERNENTKSIIHLLTTTLCNRDCKYCCNKQYDMNEILYVTDSELREAHTLCLTGGEPFLYTDPCAMAKHYKLRYRNIQNVYVYTNALELAQWLQTHTLHDIDGLNISIKTKADAKAFEHILKNHIDIISLSSNLLYIFDDLYPADPIEGFQVFKREWQPDFVPADDSIFRRC